MGGFRSIFFHHQILMSRRIEVEFSLGPLNILRYFVNSIISCFVCLVIHFRESTASSTVTLNTREACKCHLSRKLTCRPLCPASRSIPFTVRESTIIICIDELQLCFSINLGQTLRPWKRVRPSWRDSWWLLTENR